MVAPTCQPPFSGLSNATAGTWTANHIDMVYGGAFLFDGLPRFIKVLVAATKWGVMVHFIIGDLDSPAVAQRGGRHRICPGGRGAGWPWHACNRSRTQPDSRFAPTPDRYTH